MLGIISDNPLPPDGKWLDLSVRRMVDLITGSINITGYKVTDYMSLFIVNNAEFPRVTIALESLRLKNRPPELLLWTSLSTYLRNIVIPAMITTRTTDLWCQ